MPDHRRSGGSLGRKSSTVSHYDVLCDDSHSLYDDDDVSVLEHGDISAKKLPTMKVTREDGQRLRV